MAEVFQLVGICNYEYTKVQPITAHKGIKCRIYLHDDNIKSHMQPQRKIFRMHASNIMSDMYFVIEILDADDKYYCVPHQINFYKFIIPKINTDYKYKVYRCIPHIPDTVKRKSKNLKQLKWKLPLWIARYIAKHTGICMDVSKIICVYTIYPMKYLECNLIEEVDLHVL